MEELLALLETAGYSHNDALRMVAIYPELASSPNVQVAAEKMLAKRAERFIESEPEAYLEIRRPENEPNVLTYHHRMAEAYFALLSAIDWNNSDLVIGLGEGLNKFLSNVFLKAILRGTKKHHCTQLISKDALALVEAGKSENLVFEHVVPKDIYIQKPCETRAKANNLTVEFIEDVLRRYWIIASVTSAEASGLTARHMPANWDGMELLARYNSSGVALVPNPFFKLDS
ncbi:MAG TPA: hypothetical protein VGI40_14080 [Pirellulaceae bacterium]|jgi:hypothetical protein